MTLLVVARAHTSEWHAARKTMVTASRSYNLMAPLLSGSYSPWILSEVELAEDMKEGLPTPSTPAMEAGSYFEDANIGWLNEQLKGTNRQVKGDGQLYRDTERPWMGASPDGHWCWASPSPPRETQPYLMVIDSWGVLHEDGDAVQELLGGLPEGSLYEGKQVQSKGRSKWTKERPEGSLTSYYNQVQHQMLVMGTSHCFLCAKVDSFELRGYIIERDEDYCTALDEVCKRFWEKYLR